ncbi:hypothetical protein BXZ70DRAFT_931469 [Cristinia sonorae]|uniref:Yeast cell wall synthesis Kre9/Knh1-like N-terminal domain-containing protein n=1 Tax=Cristinia sonorae TaxID=1940300 RepID=A0A8K0UQ80_9AGAR|nr:hypothetical protein BXZ70DRAFT_931469 [Cristinia sonorae]
MFSALKLIALAACAQSAFAALFMTSPVASSNWAAGQQQTISWQDDGKAPSLKDFGAAKVTLSVGNSIQQTHLQTIVDNVDVSTTSSIVFTPDPSVGANGAVYFVRIESLALKDAAQPQYPALAFSAKFTLTGMTGQFSPAVQAQIDGSSTAPLGPTTTGSPTTTGASSSTTGSSSSKSASASGSKTSSPAPTNTKDSGALSMAVNGAAAVAGSVFAAALLL